MEELEPAREPSEQQVALEKARYALKQEIEAASAAAAEALDEAQEAEQRGEALLGRHDDEALQELRRCLQLLLFVVVIGRLLPLPLLLHLLLHLMLRVKRRLLLHHRAVLDVFSPRCEVQRVECLVKMVR